MKKILTALIVLLSFGINQISAQNTTEHTSKWKQLITKEGVEINYKFINCHPYREFPQEWVVLQIKNNTNTVVTLEWNLHMWFNNVCRTCDSSTGEYYRSITLKPNSHLEGNCKTAGTDNALFFFSRFTERENREVLTHFELADFKIITK